VSEDAAPRPRRPAAVRIALALLVCAIEAAILAWALGGFDRLLAHPRALALVSVWALSGAVLAWSAPARGRVSLARTPEARLGLLLLGLIPLAVAPLAALGERLQLWPLPGGAALRWTGVVLAALGLGIRVTAMRRLGARFSPTLALQPAHTLETTGIYARVRHPGYLGALLAALGAALTFGSALGLAPFAALALLLSARVRREEAMMAEHFGAGWEEYRARSGALWPRLDGPR
jgi:protein-S-isoprenylcysteine O-methyltransferase Ste14